MSGSRLGRGRGGRLAVYVGCCIVLVLLVFLYRAATTEMTRLRDVHVQCSHQQEALAAQLQVIFEYKVRLEKSLAEEKSSNAALKRELQEHVTREKSLRDKDSIEAMQKYKSLDQQFKILKTENQDLHDECDKRQKQALEETRRLETTLQELRSEIHKAKEDKKKSMEHLKNEYLRVDTEKTRLEDKYNELLKSNGNTDSTIEHLNKEVFQLKRELEETKLSCKASPSQLDLLNSRVSQASVEKSPAIEKAAVETQQQQINPVTSLPKMSTVLSSTKSSVNFASTSSLKSLNAESSMKLAPRVKLPVGVVPIPKMIVPKIDKEETNKIDGEKKQLDDNKRHNHVDYRDDVKQSDNDNGREAIGVGGKHIGEQILDRQDNAAWYKVKPGVQEIGDEPNNLRRGIPDLEEGVHQGPDQPDDQYGIDYYKEVPPKNNDIHLDEGEEEEGEDEEDYQSNPRAEKRE